ncbi:hypothetical protein [Nitrosomonas aestuarii]|uniref:hypothetical protein n=1 Tax=Nitrosomonas aestuarii TaxID=52441 RepID=UPI000D317922|nr:hypothetical protein [Nitrosomonas aestuarii]PTN11079.1 hypothetical protein C8R11_11318 [Nitrosomonas aestuarii]
MPITLIAFQAELQQPFSIAQDLAMMLAAFLILLYSYLIVFFSLSKAIMANQCTAKYMRSKPGLHIDLFQHGKKVLAFVISDPFAMILASRYDPVMNYSRNTIRFHGRITHIDQSLTIAAAGIAKNDFIACPATEQNDFLPTSHLFKYSAPRFAKGKT